MTFVADRKDETLEWFLYREKLYATREEAVADIKSGKIVINGKVKKDSDYKVKKSDKFIITGLPAGGCPVSFIVE